MGMLASGPPVTFSIVAVSAMTSPAGPRSWIISLASPSAILGSMRCKSPISSGSKFHSVSPWGRPVDNVLPRGSPLMVMMLPPGTASAPSMEIGRVVRSPAVAWRVVGAVMTAGGIMDCASGTALSLGEVATGFDEGGSITMSQRSAPTAKLGNSATMTRTAASVRMRDKSASIDPVSVAASAGETACARGATLSGIRVAVGSSARRKWSCRYFLMS